MRTLTHYGFCANSKTISLSNTLRRICSKTYRPYNTVVFEWNFCTQFVFDFYAKRPNDYYYGFTRFNWIDCFHPASLEFNTIIVSALFRFLLPTTEHFFVARQNALKYVRQYVLCKNFTLEVIRCYSTANNLSIFDSDSQVKYKKFKRTVFVNQTFTSVVFYCFGTVDCVSIVRKNHFQY